MAPLGPGQHTPTRLLRAALPSPSPSPFTPYLLSFFFFPRCCLLSFSPSVSLSPGGGRAARHLLSWVKERRRSIQSRMSGELMARESHNIYLAHPRDAKCRYHYCLNEQLDGCCSCSEMSESCVFSPGDVECSTSSIIGLK